MEEERQARRPQTSESLKKYLKEIAKLPRITVEEERRLGNAIRKGDQKAVKKLVEANLRFVVSYAKRYRGCGLSFLDLINEGNIGLIEAARRYDPRKKVKFITYAVWWIRQSIIHALSDQSGSFRLPQKQANLLYRIGKTQASLAYDLQRNPSSEEIAKKLEVDVEDVNALLAVSDENVSLSSVIDEAHEFVLSDKIEQETIPSADLVLLTSTMRRQVRGALEELDEKEKRVVGLRFGLEGDEPRTLKEIGEMMGLSRERIRQIEAQALGKLNRSAKTQSLRNYLN